MTCQLVIAREFSLSTDLLKVESVSGILDFPCRGCPSLQLQLATLLLHLFEEKEKVSGLIPAFLNSSLEQSPHILQMGIASL